MLKEKKLLKILHIVIRKEFLLSKLNNNKIIVPDLFKIIDNKIEFFGSNNGRRSKIKLLFNVSSMNELTSKMNIIQEKGVFYIETNISPYIYIRNSQKKDYSEYRYNNSLIDESNRIGTIKIIQTPYFYKNILRPHMIEIQNQTEWYLDFISDQSNEINFFKDKGLYFEQKFIDGILITVPKIDDYSDEILRMNEYSGLKKTSFHSIYKSKDNQYISFIDLTDDNLDDLKQYRDEIINKLCQLLGMEKKDIYIYCYTNNLHNPILDFYIDCVNEKNIIHKQIYQYDNIWLLDNIINHLELVKLDKAPQLKDMVFEYFVLPQGLPKFDISKYIEIVNEKINVNNMFEVKVWDDIYQKIFVNRKKISTKSLKLLKELLNDKKGGGQFLLEDINCNTCDCISDSICKKSCKKCDFYKKLESIISNNIKVTDMVLSGNSEFHLQFGDQWLKTTFSFDYLKNRELQYDLLFDNKIFRYGKVNNITIRFKLEEKGIWFKKESNLFERYVDDKNIYDSKKLQIIKDRKAVKESDNGINWQNDLKTKFGNLLGNKLSTRYTISNLNGITFLNYYGFPENIINQFKNTNGILSQFKNKSESELFYISYFFNEIIGLREIAKLNLNYLKIFIASSLLDLKRNYNLSSILFIRNYLQYPNRINVSYLHFHYHFRPSNESMIGFQSTDSEVKFRNNSLFQIFNILKNDKYIKYFEERRFSFLAENLKKEEYYSSLPDPYYN